MNKQEIATIEGVIKGLRGERGASDEVKAALTGPARLYLETWVIAPLELLIKEGRTLDDLRLARSLAH